MVAMVVFGFLVNAGASCAPSLIGGLGLLGEGMGRFPMGAFSKPNQMAILAITVATMAMIRLHYGNTLSMRTEEAPAGPSRPVPESGYLSFILFIAVLIVVVAVRLPIPIQTILTVMTVVVMFIARLSFRDLLGGIMLHPLSALVAGYVVAGALLTAGGFEVLQALLVLLAEHTLLGYIGVSILVVFLPLFLAMPCGRIISVSLIPGVLMFGGRVAEVSGFALAPAVLLASFVLSSAASCGPSPLGGVGNIGEGRLRNRGSWSSRPQALGNIFRRAVSSFAGPTARHRADGLRPGICSYNAPDRSNSGSSNQRAIRLSALSHRRRYRGPVGRRTDGGVMNRSLVRFNAAIMGILALFLLAIVANSLA